MMQSADLWQSYNFGRARWSVLSHSSQRRIRLSQKILDNTKAYRQKAKDGTLTIDDLKNLSRQNDQVIAQFPKGDRTKVGLPAKLDSREDIKALANMRLAETQAKAGSHTGLKINSLQELQTICQMPPESIATKVLDDAKRKKAERKAKQEETAKEAESTKKTEAKTNIDAKIGKTKIGYSTALEDEIFDNLRFAYMHCKPKFHSPISEWPDIQVMEDQIKYYLEVIEQNGDEYVNNLFSIIFKAEEEIDKEVAIYILASIRFGDETLLGMMVDIIKEDEELIPLVKKGLKWGMNPIIPRFAKARIHDETEKNKSLFLDVLDYHHDPGDYSHILNKVDPSLKAKILNKGAKEDLKIDFTSHFSLLDDPEAPCFEDALLAGLVYGDKQTLSLCRRICDETPEKAGNAPLYLACSGNYNDFNILSRCLKNPKPSITDLRALALYGHMDIVPQIIRFLDPETYPIKSETDFNRKNTLFECLNVITGADLVKPEPQVEENPEAKDENKIIIHFDCFTPWNRWWKKNNTRFSSSARYRRGEMFTLNSCLNEMEYPKAAYWSRQYSYYELMIRSGEKMPFEADWYVKDQQKALLDWRMETEGKIWLSAPYPWAFGGVS